MYLAQAILEDIFFLDNAYASDLVVPKICFVSSLL